MAKQSISDDLIDELVATTTGNILPVPVFPEWQPIETAPKSPDDLSETRDFLAWCPDETAPKGGEVRVVWWEPHQEGGGKWWGDRDLPERPTHWMPQPNPPASSSFQPKTKQDQSL